MASATRSIFVVTPLAPDGGPSTTVNPFNAIITPYSPVELPPIQPPDTGPPGQMPPPSIKWEFTGSGWQLAVGPFAKPQPMDPSLAGGNWEHRADGWYFVYATGDKPRPPGPISPPGQPPIDIPPDPGTPPPGTPVDTMIKNPPAGGWGTYNSSTEGAYNVYRPAPTEAQPK